MTNFSQWGGLIVRNCNGVPSVWTKSPHLKVASVFCPNLPSYLAHRERYAIARLFAAAPDLLQAAKHLSAMVDALLPAPQVLDGAARGYLEQCRAAIDKAEGRAADSEVTL